jgi:hypothetical protein
MTDPMSVNFHFKCFVMSSPVERSAWEHFRAGREIEMIDTSFSAQWMDWCRCDMPDRTVSAALAAELLEARCAASPTGNYGTWVWYPWRAEAVLLLEEEEFVAVRTNRNALKITPEAQSVLRGKTVGVVGLSVGQSTAMALAMERIVGGLKLADPDTIELSNLNRIPASVCDLGRPKAETVARRIAEVDPYLRVELFSNGFHEGVVAEFMDGLDLVVDACDAVSAKALLRIAARDRRIPLIMETNDRGMIDVERYDDEAQQDYLHGRIDAEKIQEMLEASAWTPEMLNAFVDLSAASEPALRSLEEVGKTLVSWPQLYSDVAMGSGATAHIIRRLMLGDPIADQRLHFDIHEHIAVAHTA